MKLRSGIEIPTAPIEAICRRFHIRELAVFGSAVRGDFHADSDIDIMIEFEAGSHPGLGWFDLEEELETVFCRKVDLGQKALLRPRVFREAEREAVVLYVAA